MIKRRDLEEWVKNMSDDVKDLNKELQDCPTMTPPAQQPERSELEQKFIDTWARIGGEPLEEEYEFHEYRKWRFDFAHPESKVAIEVEGGVWSKGRHVRPQGFINDCSKYNAAAADGWLVFRLPAEFIRMSNCYEISKRIHVNMKEKGNEEHTSQ